MILPAIQTSIIGMVRICVHENCHDHKHIRHNKKDNKKMHPTGSHARSFDVNLSNCYAQSFR